eukprot:scaffold1569_cov33-Attheya_sp.AAC.1
MKDKLLVQDQYIFQAPLEEWKDKTTSQLDEWLLKYKPVLKQCLSLAKKHSKQNAQDIRKFYTRTELKSSSLFFNHDVGTIGLQ